MAEDRGGTCRRRRRRPRPALATLALGLVVALAGALPAGALGQSDLRTRLPIVIIDTAGPIVDDPKVGAGMRIVHNGRGT